MTGKPLLFLSRRLFSQGTIMRTLNFKRTAVAFLVLVLVAGSTHLLHSYQVQRNASAYKIKAEDAWNAKPKRIADAVETMEDYLLLAPHDYDAREEYGGWCRRLPPIRPGHRNPGRAAPRSGKARSARSAQDAKGAAEIGRYRPGPGTLRRCRLRTWKILKKQLPHDVDLVNLLGKCLVTLGARTRPSRTSRPPSPWTPSASTSITTRPWPCAFSPRGEAGRGR